MRTWTILALALGLPLTLTGCGGDDAPPPPAPTTGQAEQDSTEAAEEEGHAGGHNEDGHHGGPKHSLGTQEVGPYEVEPTQIGDSVEAGDPATFEIVLSEADTAPDAVRAWVGNEQAVGSVKVRAVDREEFYDADLQVPDEMPEDSRFWVEIETADGERHTGSFELAG